MMCQLHRASTLPIADEAAMVRVKGYSYLSITEEVILRDNIEALHVKYYTVNMADCSSPIQKKCDYNLSSQFVHSITNAPVSYQSITAFC